MVSGPRTKLKVEAFESQNIFDVIILHLYPSLIISFEAFKPEEKAGELGMSVFLDGTIKHPSEVFKRVGRKTKLSFSNLIGVNHLKGGWWF
jgi:hypothetical protein